MAKRVTLWAVWCWARRPVRRICVSVYNSNGRAVPSMAVNARIIRFYSGTQPDHRGRYLHEIQVWTDKQLESIHDYIQWLFPLPEPSGFNTAAPVLTPESIREFRTRPELQQKLPGSFLRMMTFYGFE